MLTRSKSTLTKREITVYQKKIQKNNLIKKFVNRYRFLLNDEDLINKNKLCKTEPNEIFHRLVKSFLFHFESRKYKFDSFHFMLFFLSYYGININNNEYVLKALNEMIEIYNLDWVMKRRQYDVINRIKKIIDSDLNHEYSLFSRHKLLGPQSNEFIKSVETFLFTVGNNELMKYRKYDELLKDSREARDRYKDFLQEKKSQGYLILNYELEYTKYYK